jgi:hypothetical protein
MMKNRHVSKNQERLSFSIIVPIIIIIIVSMCNNCFLSYFLVTVINSSVFHCVGDYFFSKSTTIPVT